MTSSFPQKLFHTRKRKLGYIAERTTFNSADVPPHNLEALTAHLRGAAANGEDRTPGAATGGGPVDL